MHRDDDIDRELQFHVDRRVADYIASGLTPAEARRRVTLEFVGLTQTKEYGNTVVEWYWPVA